MISKDSAYKIVEDLVLRFEEQIVSYKKSDYNETQTRRDFIDPFFKALGWDMDNSQGNAEAYREVIHEDRVKVGAATKAPDYSFKLAGGKRLFFVEAKKPSVLVKNEVLPAYQVRRYAWSAKLPVSILTDFEEFAIYDCNKKPNATDKSSVGRIKYLTYKDYLNEFEFIWDTFSKERVLKGSFDKFIAADKNKKGTATVDKEFLNSLDEWRKQLALNIALRNETLTEDELNFVVQQTLDRLIFLRIAEDRGVEEYGRLKNLLKGEDYYQNLFTYFKEADSKYNSGLFDFKKDSISSKVVIDNKTIKGIISELYYPISPYEFSVLSVEILGSAYEQFLGKQIKLTAGHRAIIEEKPEVRKAGGVYYTPQYIVEYIVENTVGKLTAGKKPADIAKLKIVDPACGSGSFLLGAYQYLLNWHVQFYKPEFEKLTAIAQNNGNYNEKQRNEAIKERNKLPLTPTGNLTTALKKQILLNNIYGVDIDTQAVEVTKLSLLLKCMEGETGSSITAEMRFGERILPTLDSNIKSGNSLIDTDFYDGQIDFEPALEKKVKPFSWEKGFVEVFKKGGFDAVIGNPPYGALFLTEETKYIVTKYKGTKKFPDSYCAFMIRAANILKLKGLLGFIIPNTFCDLESCNDFREWFLTEMSPQIIYQTGWAFKDAIVDTLVFISENSRCKKDNNITIQIGNKNYRREVNDFLNNQLFKIDYRNTQEDLRLLNRIHTVPIVSSFAIVKAGVKMYEKGKGNPPQTEITLKERPYSKIGEKPNGWFSLFRGEDVNRYFLAKEKEFVDYGPWLAAPRSKELFESPKILMRRTDDKLKSTLDFNNSICVNSCHVIKLNELFIKEINYHYLLGLLNSRFIQKIFELQNPQMIGKVFSEVKVIYVERLPIKKIDGQNKSEKSLHDEIVQLVETMLQLQQQKKTTNLPDQLQQLEQRIAYTDDKINEKVYTLYGLSEEEVRVVEGR